MQHNEEESSTEARRAPSAIERWATAVERVLPEDERQSARWRAIVGIAREASSEHEPEAERLITAWLWRSVALLVDKLPEPMRPAWHQACREHSAGYSDWAVPVIERVLGLTQMTVDEGDKFWLQVNPTKLLIHFLALTQKRATS